MKTLLPAPLLSLCVFVVWLLLVGSLEPGHLLLAAALAIVLPRFAHRLRGAHAGLRRPWRAAHLFGRVLWDIVVSNLQVARLVLGRESRIRPGFFWLPLDLRNPHAIATLAGIITLTPGTLSAEVSADDRYLLVHSLDLQDVQGAIEQIKQRYEAPLKEIFE